jgi:hypothetical protein
LYGNLSSYLLVLFDEKSQLSAAQAVFLTAVWEIPNRPSNMKCMDPAFFCDRFVEKEGSLST